MSNKNSNGSLVQVVRPLSSSEVDDLMLYLICTPEVYEAATGQLLPEHFDIVSEPHYSLLWCKLCEHREQHGGLSYIDLRRELAGVVEDDAGFTFSPQQVNSLLYEDDSRVHAGLLYFAFYLVSEDELNPAIGMKLLQRFLMERAVVGPIKQTLAATGSNLPLDFSELIAAVGDKYDIVENLGQSQEVLPISDDEVIEVRDSFPVAVPVIAEHFMTGGQAEGEVYCIMAPTGTGKTSILTHVAVGTGQFFFEQHMRQGQPLKHVRYYSWEESAQEIGWRLTACAAQIPKQRLESPELRAQLTSSQRGDPLQDYEHRLCVNMCDAIGNRRPGEVERREEAKWLNRNVRVIDMIESPRSGELLKGIESDCTAHMRATGEPIGMILIDHAMAVADAHIEAGRARFDDMRHILRTIASSAKRLAVKFKCPVWIAHQASTEFLGKSATRRIHAGAGAECKGFEQPMTYSFVLGTKDGTSGMSVLWCTKDRRTGNSGRCVPVLLDGAMQRLSDASTGFVIDNITGRIVNREDRGAFAMESSRTGHTRQLRDGVS